MLLFQKLCDAGIVAVADADAVFWQKCRKAGESVRDVVDVLVAIEVILVDDGSTDDTAPPPPRITGTLGRSCPTGGGPGGLGGAAVAETDIVAARPAATRVARALRVGFITSR